MDARCPDGFVLISLLLWFLEIRCLNIGTKIFKTWLLAVKPFQHALFHFLHVIVPSTELIWFRLLGMLDALFGCPQYLRNFVYIPFKNEVQPFGIHLVRMRQGPCLVDRNTDERHVLRMLRHMGSLRHTDTGKGNGSIQKYDMILRSVPARIQILPSTWPLLKLCGGNSSAPSKKRVRVAWVPSM
eukprot:14111105-Ditylum_brightwellii.AAC.1